MMKRIQTIYIVCFVLLTQNGFAQQKVTANVTMETKSERKNEIVYRKGTKLELSDFHGDDEPNVDAVAMAYSGVSVRYTGTIKNGLIKLEIKMYASFDKSKSWCLETSRNERTLAHEQRHFDITALNACALFEELQSYQFTKNFEREIADLQKKYQKKNESDQDDYDAETNHGIKREVQEEWNQKILKAISEAGSCFPN